jgi:ABC-type transport system involved in multi-copper enzyme maturation permease subunit
MPLVGPLFRYELTRLARRGLQPRLRAVFAGLLLGALLLIYLQEFPGVSPVRVLFHLGEPLRIDRGSRFGERFLVSFLFVQLMVVMVATPAVVGGALAEEKERGSLDFLLATPLTDREIVLGKVAARLVFVGGVVLTGLPVLALTRFFGGVDTGLLLAGYAITLLTMFSLGAYSAYLATMYDTLRAVLLRAYTVALGLTVFGLCCWFAYLPSLASPFSALGFLFYQPQDQFWGNVPLVVGVYAVTHLLFGGLCLLLATAQVRGLARSPQPIQPRPGLPQYGWREGLNPEGQPPSHRGSMDAVRWRTVPPLQDDEDPLAWKERHFGARLWPRPDGAPVAVLLSVLILVGPFLFMGLFAITAEQLAQGKPLAPVYGTLAWVVFVVLLPLVAIGVGVLTAGSIASERQRQTLDSLLSLPVARRDILRAKLLNAWAKIRLWVIGIAAIYLVGLLTGGLEFVTIVTFPVVTVGWLWCAAALGVWLSCRCRTVERATGYFLAAVLAAAILPPLVGPLVRNSFPDPRSPAAGFAKAMTDGLSPVMGAWNALPTAHNPRPGEEVLPGFVGAVVAALLGAILWRAAVRRFDREGK